jgi:hypothetical protein
VSFLSVPDNRVYDGDEILKISTVHWTFTIFMSLTFEAQVDAILERFKYLAFNHPL